MTEDLPPLKTGLTPVSKAPAPAGFFESAGAAWEADTVRTDVNGHSLGLRRGLTMQMYGLLSPEGQRRVQGRNARVDPLVRDHVYLEDFVMEEFATERPPVGNFPTTREDFTARINAERMRELEDAQTVLDRPGGGFGEFAGSMARAISDPINIALMPLGIGGGAVRVMASEMALGGLGEALSLPRENQVATELGIEQPDAMTRIGVGALAGGVLGGALYGLGHLAVRAVERAAYPKGVPATQAQAEIARAEGQMRGDQTPDEMLGTAPAAPGLPPIPPDAPPGWAEIRNGIFAGESGGDYEALFGYSNREGGPFQNVRLTQMSVDEAIEFSAPSGAYGQWVKGRIGRVATPMGAYQIVGTTLRAAKKGLGLRGDEIMTKELQDRLGIWILRQQGTGAWEGYRGPRSSFDAPEGAAPYVPTSRGYTGTGQVNAGDEFRIDVDYRVVDMASLTRATGDLQPRDRSRINSDEWIAATAARLDPAKLMPNPDASTGTPIIGPGGVIESGNGRVAVIDRAYTLHPDRAAAYRAQIEAAGFDIPQGMERPVLVAERKTPLDDANLRKFTVAAQDGGVAQLTPTEQAQTMARLMRAPVMARMNPDLPAGHATNTEFRLAVMEGLPRSTRNAMIDKDGGLNSYGQWLMKNAMFARAWKDQDILAAFAEAAPEELEGLFAALNKAAPSWAALVADIEAGLVRPDMDIAPFVLDAVRIIDAARLASERGGPSIAGALDDLLNQIDMVNGAVSPLTTALVRKFWRNGRMVAGKDITAFLKQYAQDARQAGRTGQLVEAQGPAEVLRQIDPATFGDLPDDLGRTRAQAQDPLPQVQLPEAGLEEGALSPDAIEADAAAADDLVAGVAAEDAAPVDAPALVANMTADGPRQLVVVADLADEAADALQLLLKRAQPFDTADTLMTAAAKNHEALNAAAAEAAAVLNLPFKPAPLKTLDRVLQKVTTKYGGDFRGVADVARSGVTVDTIEAADRFVARMAKRFHLIDEGWIVTPEGYLDRKVMVRFDDGMLGELQIWPPGMREAKGDGGGHALYKVATDPMAEPAARDRARAQMRDLYGRVTATLDPSFQSRLGIETPRDANILAAPSADNSLARSSPNTSRAMGRDQSSGTQLPSNDRNLALPSSVTAWSDPKSLLNNFMGDIPPSSGDTNNISARAGEVNQAARRPELDAAFAAYPIDMPDGSTRTAAEVLRDLDDDAQFDAFIQACAITQGEPA